jgi:MoaA/NifB/PqqE/SkfB family radical SAM enzyme/polysaccharide pyruvyl transferase WcaK-like protein
LNLKNVIYSISDLFGRSVPKLEKPIVVQFPVIDICNSRCQMCRIWENKQSTDITVEQLKKGLESGLFDNVQAIGFNGGEPTLREDLAELVNVVVDSLPSLKNVSLITNAFKYLQVIEQIRSMAEIVKAKGLHFDVMVSLDGFEETHDTVRGRGGNFENAKKVIAFLQQYKSVDNVRIGCTVIRENVLELAPLLDFCIESNLYIKYRLGVPHQRLYTENLLDPYALTFEEKYEFVEFLEGLIKYYEKSESQNYFYRSLIDQIINDKPRKAGCDWKHRGATITAKGELAYCAVQSKALMPDIGSGDPLQAYFAGESHLQEIIKNKCSSCNHDYTGLPAPVEYRKYLLNRISEKMGIKKLAQRIPGFKYVNGIRNAHNYRRYLNRFRLINTKKNLPLANRRILICGWYGTETLGDKAIIAGVMSALRKKYGEEVQFVVVALFTYITEITRRQMPEFKNVVVVDPEQGASLAAEMDMVVFGGGPLMAIQELAPMQAIFERAKASGVSTVIAGCGIGPFGDSWRNDSIKRILELSDIRIYRDHRSKDFAAQLGINVQSDVVAEDPAFTWLAEHHYEDILNTPTKMNKTLLLGLRDFPYEDYARHLPGEEGLNIKNTYEKVIVMTLELLCQRIPSLVIKPLPMCTNHFGSDDRWFYRRLFRGNRLISPHLDNSLLGQEMPPAQYCNAFKTADCLLAMRFHSLVFGIGLGTNAVALDYTLGKGKVRSLAERFDIDYMCMTQMDAVLLADKIEASLDLPTKDGIKLDELSFTNALLNKLNELPV